MLEMEIAGRKIGPGHPPYIIAELSANHRGSLDEALRIMTLAKDTGADAIKIQSYTPDTITIDHNGPGFVINGGLWNGRTLYDLYKEAYTPFEWHKAIFEHAKKLGITVFSTPFDDTAVDLLESLDAPAYKIASFEAIDLPLIRRAAKAGKPMIISTGMANHDEMLAARDAAIGAGCKEIAMLHCISAYPAPADKYNLATIPDMAKRLGVIPGLSDHTLGTTVAVAAVALGACVIEKHFIDSRANGGADAAFSLEPDEFKRMCDDAREAFLAVGSPNYVRERSEDAMRVFRRSLYVVKPIAKGEVFSRENIRSIRPGYGLPPDRISDFLGKPAAVDIAYGEPLADKHLD